MCIKRTEDNANTCWHANVKRGNSSWSPRLRATGCQCLPREEETVSSRDRLPCKVSLSLVVNLGHMYRRANLNGLSSYTHVRIYGLLNNKNQRRDREFGREDEGGAREEKKGGRINVDTILKK